MLSAVSVCVAPIGGYFKPPLPSLSGQHGGWVQWSAICSILVNTRLFTKLLNVPTAMCVEN